MADLVMKCPYCQHECVSNAKRCEECSTTFPWVAEIDRLESVVKERESNRLRATVTLVQEIFSAIDGGPRVSVSAIKGFVAAWLFPTAVIAVGSLLGVIFVGLQTWILFNQNKLLAIQTRADQLEGASKLRQSLIETTNIRNDLITLQSFVSHPLEAPMCETQGCEGGILKTLSAIESGSDQMGPTGAVRTAWADVAGRLTPIKKQWPAVAPKLRGLEMAGIERCLLDPVAASQALELLGTYAIAVHIPFERALGLEPNRSAPEVLDQWAVQFVGRGGARFGALTIQPQAETYNIAAFIGELNQVRSELDQMIGQSVASCSSQMERDSDDLKVMEQSLN